MNEHSAVRAVQTVAADVVQPGDVLLMRGRSELSTLIAWASDSVYSHCAVMADDGQLYESITHGIMSVPLAPRLAEGSPVYLVDAFRPVAYDRSPLSEQEQAQVVAHGTGLLGLPYATSELAMIGIVVAVRGKSFPGAPMWLRSVLRAAFDSLLSDDAGKMTCSEFVYRCFAENAARPKGRLAPEIVVTPPPDPPLPYTGNVRKLIEEVWSLLRPQHKARFLQAGVDMAGSATPTDLERRVGDVSAAELEALASEVRARLGIGEQVPAQFKSAARSALQGLPEAVLPFAATHPKGVSPGDLAHTPSHQPLGRLMQAPDWRG